MHWKAYWHLMRFHKPVGIFLLWYPTIWALWTANKGAPPIKLLVLFSVGTILMRAAGCVINDMTDIKIDKQVTRTKFRPLAHGTIFLYQASIVVIVLLSAALLILLQLPLGCFYWGIAALVITGIYPFCKRYLSAPQLILGFAFSMGIPMAYIASSVALDYACLLLFIINFCWIVAYDTMYAMVDRPDDLSIGVNSTAVFFGSYECFIIGVLQGLLHALWLNWSTYFNINFIFYIFWIFAALVLGYQQILVNKRDLDCCFKAFNISMYYGLTMSLGILFGFFK